MHYLKILANTALHDALLISLQHITMSLIIVQQSDDICSVVVQWWSLSTDG